ncbi:hypothetical protein EVJ58_g4989 [Rhodofomes roseus]|uniref:Uncharacterized protein n=1 Tax=Rhodofomes roseus TaxID=34475 RepID=A0A4Y9YG56_9APHY|nr:hypothetical protein EVJ58_g4989 [Rhodofomes roseus]
MAGTSRLFRLEEHDYPRLHDLLSPFLPESITILGWFEQHRDAPPVPPIWASFSVAEPAPPLLALFVLGTEIAGYQSRLFCSAEASPGQPTPEQETFVASFVEASLRAAFDYIAETSPAGALIRESGLMIGSIHEKWHDCLRALPYAGSHSPCRKVVLPPSAARAFAEGASDARLPPGARVTQLQNGDLETVMRYNKIARTTAYVKSRMEQSVCIRAPGPDGEEVPVAWTVVHADSSIGQLHVIDISKTGRNCYDLR